MTAPTRPAVRALAVTGALVLALTGCGAGLDAYTYQERPQAQNTNVDLAPLRLRNITVDAPPGGSRYTAGAQAFGRFTVTNNSGEPDTLVSITSPDAASVVPTVGGRPVPVEVPGQGTTGTETGFVLKGLNADVAAGEFVTLVFLFENAGSVETLVPVTTTGRTDRPEFTGEPGSEEGEPALQGPAGGHHSEEEEGAEASGESGSSAEIGVGEQGSAENGSAEAEAEPAASPTAAP